ncbi:MAG: PilZ domain-containing protein [Acidobacteria bacterium]|nr:MAG: PilZ domain-containing protein [Acidobacteriota bacterium]
MSPRGDVRTPTRGPVRYERRAVPRVEPRLPLDAKVMTIQSARVLNISSRGAQIEVARALPPAGMCDLRIQFEEGEFAAHATVLRCTAVELGTNDTEGSGVLYRAGLQFGDLDPESLAWLSANVLYADA